MSNFRNKLLSISGEISREEQLENLNEDHRLIVRNNSAEVNLRNAFQELMSQIQNLEYQLGGFNSLPYGTKSPEKIIEQARNTQEQLKKLKMIAYEKLEELKQVIDEVLCPDEYYEGKEKKKDYKPEVKMEIGTTDFEDKVDDLDYEDDSWDDFDDDWEDEEVPYYSKSEKKKSGKKYALKMKPEMSKETNHEKENEYMKNPGKFYSKKHQEEGPFFGKKYSMDSTDKAYAKKSVKKRYSKKDC
jgi:hypothetical protein